MNICVIEAKNKNRRLINCNDIVNHVLKLFVNDVTLFKMQKNIVLIITGTILKSQATFVLSLLLCYYHSLIVSIKYSINYISKFFKRSINILVCLEASTISMKI